MPEKDVEQLLVSLILDNRIQGHIDQVNKLLERSDRSHTFPLFLLDFECMMQDPSLKPPQLSQVQGNEEICCHRQVEHSA